jgi:hypothetical protein
MSKDVTGTGATEIEPTGTGADAGLAEALDETSGPSENPQGPRGAGPTFDRTGNPVSPESGGDLEGDPLVRHDG